MMMKNFLSLPMPFRKSTTLDSRYAFAVDGNMKKRLKACLDAGLDVPERIRQLVAADLPNMEAEVKSRRAEAHGHQRE